MSKSTRKSTKLPARLPIYVCKCVWDSTALLIKVEAKDEVTAKDVAWRKVAKMEGGGLCLRVIVKGRV